MGFASQPILDLSTPRIMGVLNVTPDSFSDGGRFQRLDEALLQADRMIAAGASIIDVGGESTRPGAASVSLDDELARVIPVIEALSHQFPETLISVDTCKFEVMQAAIEAGAGMVNDVTALHSVSAMDYLAQQSVYICLMHMQGEPRTMQQNPSYDEVVSEVYAFLQRRLDACESKGIDRQRLIIDPGFGFGKTLQHNLKLLARLADFKALGVLIVVGLSRKSMIGQIVDKPVEQRMVGSVAAALIAVQQGANIVRVHDVEATQDALRVWLATTGQLQLAS